MSEGKQKHQRELDFTRGEQLGLLRDWKPPRKTGVSSITLKAILKAIDDFGRGRASFASHKTIAKAAGCSVRTSKKAVKALRELSLVAITRRSDGRPGATNHIAIVWTELALLAPYKAANNEELESAAETERSAVDSERSAVQAKTSAVPSRRSETLESHKNRLPLPPQNEVEESHWREVEAALVSCGVAKRQQPLAHLRQTVGPQHALEIIAFYRRAGSCWEPGGLRFRLLNAHPQLKIEIGWPPPAEPRGDVQRACKLLTDARQYVASKQIPWSLKAFVRQAARQGISEAAAREALVREQLTIGANER